MIYVYIYIYIYLFIYLYININLIRNICNKCSVLFPSSTHHMPTVNINAVNKTEYSSCLIVDNSYS